MSKEEYTHVTHDLTLNMAQLLARLNPEMTFCYVTGAGTDSSEQGRIAWARVKGATENALIRLFKHAYMFRHDQCRQQRLSEANSGSGGHRQVGCCLRPASIQYRSPNSAALVCATVSTKSARSR